VSPRGARRLAFALILALGLAACATRPPAPEVAAGPADNLPPAFVPDTAASGGERLAAQALAMLGQPYRWGGAAPGGFDCSGLVFYAARQAGIPVPRTAAEQLKAGVAVARAQLEAGDLVFLHLAAKELHVGIALDRTRFVHAPSSGGRVRIDSLAARPYSRAFLDARRLAFTPAEPAR
jgi:cell wall-associated NlpC family hydrolase